MVWILIATLVVTALVAAPTIYTIAGRSLDSTTVGVLWRIAPHQFVFTLIVVPFLTFLVGCSLWWTVVFTKTSAPDGTFVARVAVNWPVTFLVSVGVSAIVAAVFYLDITWSPDKLRPAYAKQLARAIAAVENERDNAVTKTAKNRLAQRLADARTAGRDLKLAPGPDLDQDLASLPPLEKAQVFLSGERQRSLSLVDEVLTSLNGFQVWVGLALGVLLFECAALICFTALTYPIDVEATSALNSARRATLFAAAAFVFYPYLFGVYKDEIVRIVGTGTTSSQDIIAGVVIMICFALIVLSERKVSASSIGGIVGLLLVIPEISGVARSVLRPLVGWESNKASQAALMLIAAVLGAIAIVAARPQT